MAEMMVHVGLGWGVFKCPIKQQYIDFGMPISYTTDAPIDTLEAINNALQHKTDLRLEYDAEDKGYWTICADESKVFATREEEKGTVSYELDITKNDLMKQLVTDILEDVDGWAAFCFDEDNLEQLKKQITDLGSQCISLLG